MDSPLSRLRSLTPVQLRRWARIIAALTCLLFIVSVYHRLGVAYVTDSFTSLSCELCSGELILRWDCNAAQCAPNHEFGLHLVHGYGGETAQVAWRPYHSQCTCCGPSDYEAINIPLWIPTVASLLGVGYASGIVRGLRRVDRGRCRVCGCDLTGIVLGPGYGCPSCGSKHAANALTVHCRACGYDLAGTPIDSGRRCKCPECGTTAVRPTS